MNRRWRAKRPVPASCSEEFRGGSLPGIAEIGERLWWETPAPQSLGRQEYGSPAIGQVYATYIRQLGARAEVRPHGSAVVCFPSGQPRGVECRLSEKPTTDSHKREGRSQHWDQRRQRGHPITRRNYNSSN